MTVLADGFAAGEPRERDAGLDEDGGLENDRPDHLRLGGGPAPQRLDPGPGGEQQAGAEHADREGLDHLSIIADAGSTPVRPPRLPDSRRRCPALGALDPVPTNPARPRRLR